MPIPNTLPAAHFCKYYFTSLKIPTFAFRLNYAQSN